MTAINPSLDRSISLRRVLFADAATCLGAGALLALGAEPLSALLGLPAGLLLYAGVILFPIAAFMLWAATRAGVPGAAVRLVVGGNVAWVVGSIAVLVALSPTALGFVFVIAQAAVVALLAGLERTGLRSAAA